MSTQDFPFEQIRERKDESHGESNGRILSDTTVDRVSLSLSLTFIYSVLFLILFEKASQSPSIISRIRSFFGFDVTLPPRSGASHSFLHFPM
jgi:hypothetical protein